MREFIRVHNDGDLDGGALSRGTGTFESSEAQCSGRMIGCNSQGEPG